MSDMTASESILNYLQTPTLSYSNNNLSEVLGIPQPSVRREMNTLFGKGLVTVVGKIGNEKRYRATV